MIIPKVFTREFPLMLCEIWSNVYKNFMDLETKTFPGYILVMKNGLVECYRNEDLMVEILNYLHDKVKEDSDFFVKFYDLSLERFAHLEEMWEKPYLNNNELIDFSEKMREFWFSIYCSMYPAENPDLFSKKDIELMKKLRSEIDAAADEATNIIVKSLHRLYPELGNWVNYISFEDLSRNFIDMKKIKERSNENIFIIQGEIKDSYYFEKLKEEYGFELEKIDVPDRVEEVTGQIACKGNAKGRVRVIMKREDVQKMQDGEVLVSSMTVPDFLPAMKKAVAFVTDEGGITCHAAIVARELNKPCIIGTKIATKVLRGVHIVEVDADQGIVRKIR